MKNAAKSERIVSYVICFIIFALADLLLCGLLDDYSSAGEAFISGLIGVVLVSLSHLFKEIDRLRNELNEYSNNKDN